MAKINIYNINSSDNFLSVIISIVALLISISSIYLTFFKNGKIKIHAVDNLVEIDKGAKHVDIPIVVSNSGTKTIYATNLEWSVDKSLKSLLDVNSSGHPSFSDNRTMIVLGPYQQKIDNLRVNLKSGNNYKELKGRHFIKVKYHINKLNKEKTICKKLEITNTINNLIKANIQ
jgi:hypothetical protein